MSDKTAADLIQKLPDAFRPGRAWATIQFHISINIGLHQKVERWFVRV